MLGLKFGRRTASSIRLAEHKSEGDDEQLITKVAADLQDPLRQSSRLRAIAATCTADRALMRSERRPKCLLLSPDIASVQMCRWRQARIPFIIEIGAKIKSP